ncbi:TIGR03905 family TSCPD domain-containing protein [bacterium]|nr:TIGR03905 family TSCPD domain-containing protein [bacterium]
MASEIIEYETYGTCCRMMRVEIGEDGTVLNSDFLGGCNGNLQGIRSLIQGMKIDDVIQKLQGISCNGKPTSCPDQLATCLLNYKQQKENVNA